MVRIIDPHLTSGLRTIDVDLLLGAARKLGNSGDAVAGSLTAQILLRLQSSSSHLKLLRNNTSSF